MGNNRRRAVGYTESEKGCSVIPVTEHPAASGILNSRFRECERHENDLRGYGPCFRVHDRHGLDHDHCADRVMKDVLRFLGQGFALFAGWPAVIYPYPASSRRAAVTEAQKQVRGSSEW